VASVVSYGKLRRVDFSLTPCGPRKTVRLGRVSAKAADMFSTRLESIIADRLLHRPHDVETATWLGQLDEKLLGRLRAVGLADGVGLASTTLAAFLERCWATLAVKPATATFYGHTRRNLLDYFGGTRELRSIGAADADAWRAWLTEHERLSPATVARRVIAARTLWRRAIRWQLANANPFAGVRGGTQTNESRKRFVPWADVQRVLDICPDPELRAVILLGRIGGLRIPSEALALRWGDVDFEAGIIRVPCPKLEHVEGCGYRSVPLFPELRTPLLDLFAEAEPGTEHVITRLRGGCQNWRTQFERLIVRAGLKPWPKPFHALRASRETELLRTYDLNTVVKWIGNSPTIAARHYCTSVDLNADFARACGRDVAQAQQQAQQKAQQPAAGSARQDATTQHADCRNPRENKGLDVHGEPVPHAVATAQWAIQDSNL